MAKTTILSTSIDADLKRAVNAVSKSKGVKIRSFVEQALREQLEDYLDIETYYNRRDEPLVETAEIKRYFKSIRAK